MNILIVSTSDICGLMSNLKNMIHKYTDHKCLLFVNDINYYHTNIDSTDAILNNDYGHINKIIDDVDVIHWNYITPNIIHEQYNIPHVSKEFVHCHGSELRNSSMCDDFAPKEYPLLYATPDMELFTNGRNAMWLPNPLNESIEPITHFNDTPIIFHSPTGNVSINDYLELINIPYTDMLKYDWQGTKNNTIKHTDVFLRECEAHRIKYKMMGFMPNHLRLQDIRNCNMLFDNIFLGSYGVGALESMAMGQLVFNRQSELTMKHLNRIHSKPCPIINIDESNFYDTIQNAIDNKKWLELKEDNINWVHAVHGGVNVTTMYFDFINTL